MGFSLTLSDPRGRLLNTLPPLPAGMEMAKSEVTGGEVCRPREGGFWEAESGGWRVGCVDQHSSLCTCGGAHFSLSCFPDERCEFIGSIPPCPTHFCEP